MKRPILYCAIAFCAGIYLASLSNIPVVYSSILCLILVLLAVASVKKNILSHVFLYLALLSFGAAYCQNSLVLQSDHIANFSTGIGSKVSLEGVVVDEPVIKKAFYGKRKISFLTRAEHLKSTEKTSLRAPSNDEWQKVSGLVKVDVYADKASVIPQVGDKLILYGKLSTPEGLKNPGLFDYSEYLKLRNIYAVMSVSGNSSVKMVASPPDNSLMRRIFFV